MSSTSHEALRRAWRLLHQDLPGTVPRNAIAIQFGHYLSGFIAVEGNVTPKELCKLLKEDPKVEELKFREISTAEKNNIGDHAQRRTYKIKLIEAPRWIDIEMARNDIWKNNKKYLHTTTVMFNDEANNQDVPAWDLLRRMLLKRAVNTKDVDAWYDVVVQWQMERARQQERLTRRMIRVSIILANKWRSTQMHISLTLLDHAPKKIYDSQMA